jgi:hypothetical protein
MKSALIHFLVMRTPKLNIYFARKKKSNLISINWNLWYEHQKTQHHQYRSLSVYPILSPFNPIHLRKPSRLAQQHFFCYVQKDLIWIPVILTEVLVVLWSKTQDRTLKQATIILVHHSQIFLTCYTTSVIRALLRNSWITVNNYIVKMYFIFTYRGTGRDITTWLCDNVIS